MTVVIGDSSVPIASRIPRIGRCGAVKNRTYRAWGQCGSVWSVSLILRSTIILTEQNFIEFFLYPEQHIRYGYDRNRYEEEARAKTGNLHGGRLRQQRIATPPVI